MMIHTSRIASCMIALTSMLAVSQAQEERTDLFESVAAITLDMSSVAIDAKAASMIENGITEYYAGLLNDPSHNALPETSEIISVRTDVNSDAALETVDTATFNATNISNETETETTRVFASIHVLQTGETGLPDLAGLLVLLTDRQSNSTVQPLVELQNAIGLNITVQKMSLTNERGSTLVITLNGADEDATDSERSSEEQALIIAISVLSFALVFVSIVLFWIAGGWLELRKQIRILVHKEEEQSRIAGALESKPTQDTDVEAASPANDDDETNMTNPSGILGMNAHGTRTNQLNVMSGLGVKMTPARSTAGFSDMGSELATPMSETTEFSETGRMPLGITSMRKLLPNNGGEMNGGMSNFRVERLLYK